MIDFRRLTYTDMIYRVEIVLRYKSEGNTGKHDHFFDDILFTLDKHQDDWSFTKRVNLRIPFWEVKYGNFM